MKYLDEYRDSDLVQKLSKKIHATATRPWKIMEICGGQTHSIVKYGIDRLIPSLITLIHGPGCPVCVTPMEKINKAIALARKPGVIFCSFGDMLRVPGTETDLLSVKAQGADVRIVYSPLDALALAEKNPNRTVVFFAVGFETTAPANAMAVYQAKQKGIKNFSILASHVMVPPAMEAILSSTDNQVQGFLAAGHVCTVMGFNAYPPIAEKYRVPIVVTGFEPVDIMEGILMCVEQLEKGQCVVENQYVRSVQREGNRQAQNMISEVFETAHQNWRGIGSIPMSGLRLRPAYAAHDAELIHGPFDQSSEEPSECISGDILKGLKKPAECPAFGTRCHPEKPLGAPMVSSEGACAAYFRYRFHEHAMGTAKG